MRVEGVEGADAGEVFVVHKPPGWNVSVSFDEWDEREARWALGCLKVHGRTVGRVVR